MCKSDNWVHTALTAGVPHHRYASCQTSCGAYTRKLESKEESNANVVMAMKRAAVFYKFKDELLSYLAPAFIKINIDFCTAKQGREVCFVTFFWVLLFPAWPREKELFCTGGFCNVVKGEVSQVTDVYCVNDFFFFRFRSIF